MPGSILGNAVRRVEDPAILLGHAEYVDDLPIPGILTLVLVRSQVAHARIRSIDISAALEMPGVSAVYTSENLDLPADPGLMKLHELLERPLLAQGKVRFVGDVVAAVVAESRGAGVDASEAVVIEYDPLPAVVDMEAALAPGAPLLFEALGTNLATSTVAGNSADPLAGAEVVVRGRFENQRVAVAPMEGNAIAVVPGDDGDGHELTVFVATQMPHLFHGRPVALAGLEPERVRVVAPYVGGAFGGKVWCPEHILAICLARELGRPVKWVETRSENMIAMGHGRAQVQYVEMGYTRDGVIVGARCRFIGDAGAYGGFGGALVAGPTRMMAQGVYRIPAISYEAAVSLTNTTPTGAFRGAGRPEAAAYLERIMDMAADELAIDPTELRRKNFIAPDAFPYTTAMGTVYDNGEYDRALTEALRVVGYDELRSEQAERRARGDTKLLGIGMAAYVEITGFPGSEYGDVEVHPDGTATIKVGTSAHGQGHATSFSMIVADQLGIPIEAIRFVQSDTAEVPRGGGTGGSRSLQLGGNAVNGAAAMVLARARELAAQLLEASVDDIVVTDDGLIGVVGVPSRALSWAELSPRQPTRGIRCEASSISRRPRQPSRSARTSPWSKSTPRPASSRSCASSRSTIVVGSSIR